MRGKKWGSRFAMLAIAGMVATACEAAEEEPAIEEPAVTETPAGAPPAAGEVPAELQGVVTAEEVAMGRQIFAGKGNCATCHGPEGQGTTLAPNLTDDEWLWVTAAADPNVLRDELMRVVHEGVTQPRQFPAPMPPMGGGQLSDEEMRAVAAYILTL